MEYLQDPPKPMVASNNSDGRNLQSKKVSTSITLTVLRTPVGDSPKISSENISADFSL